MHTGLVAAAIVVTVVSACGNTVTSSSTDGSNEHRPLTELEPGGASFEALVGGTLGLNSEDCFTLDGSVFVAPYGSEVAGDGVEIEGMGLFALGSQVKGTGGHVHFADFIAPAQARYRSCRGDAGDQADFVVISG
jgi:hypothetical protein